MASPSSNAAIEKAKKVGVIEHTKKKALEALKATAEASTKALAASKAALKRANEQPNVPQIVTMGVTAVPFAVVGAAAQKGLANATANMVKADEADAAQFVSTVARKIVVHGTIPVIGVAIAFVSAKVAKTKGLMAAGGIGVGIGLLIGSLVRSWQVPLQAQAPVEG